LSTFGKFTLCWLEKMAWSGAESKNGFGYKPVNQYFTCTAETFPSSRTTAAIPLLIDRRYEPTVCELVIATQKIDIS
jgi:hypothetical protein